MFLISLKMDIWDWEIFLLAYISIKIIAHGFQWYCRHCFLYFFVNFVYILCYHTFLHLSFDVYWLDWLGLTYICTFCCKNIFIIIIFIYSKHLLMHGTTQSCILFFIYNKFNFDWSVITSWMISSNPYVFMHTSNHFCMKT